MLTMILIALGRPLLDAAAKSTEAPGATIRAVLEKWTADFNAGNAEKVCGLFSSELRYDFRGHPERNYRDICSLLHRSLEDGTKKYTYALRIIAVVRLVWTLRMRSTNPPDSSVESIESGMDIFRREADGSWKIIRYIAYEE